LRLASPVAPRQRLYEIHRQLKGIGGSRSSGFGPNRVSSLPDGVAQIVGEYLEATAHKFDDEYAPLPIKKKTNGKHTKNGEAHADHKADDHKVDDHKVDDHKVDIHKVGDICPECGHASVINEEGCRKCYNCGYSEC
jgi:ribonucleoside-diphosphate reductase alpha chain